MKKINIVICLIASLLLLMSCGNIPVESKEETTTVETTTAEASIMAETTTTMETTTAETTTETTSETTTANTEETTTAETLATEETVLETLPDMFVELMKRPDTGEYFGTGKKSDVRRFFPDPKEQYVGVYYRVVGYDPSMEEEIPGSICSRWFIEIIDIYGEEKYAEADQIDYDKIYTTAMRGIPNSTLYGIPVPTIGEDYFRYAPLYEVISGDLWVSLYMDVREVDGVKWLYGYNMDLSGFKGAVKITDHKENQVYNEENHYKIIAYLNKIGKSLPTFDYKIKMEDFLDELGILEKD